MLPVLVVSDIRLFREGLVQILGRDPRVRVIGAAPDAAGALAQVQRGTPVVALVDLASAAALATVRGIVRAQPESRVVVIGVDDKDPSVIDCAEAGVIGYVPREGALEDLIAAIESAAKGEVRCSPRLAATLVQRIATLAGDASLADDRLTVREGEIGRLIGRGLSNKEIATRLGIELSTVKNHVHNLLAKLHVRRRAEAAARIQGPPTI